MRPSEELALQELAAWQEQQEQAWQEQALQQPAW